jgi:hypothetical protein
MNPDLFWGCAADQQARDQTPQGHDLLWFDLKEKIILAAGMLGGPGVALANNFQARRGQCTQAHRPARCASLMFVRLYCLRLVSGACCLGN